MNVYKQNLMLRADHRRMEEKLYFAKSLLSKRNLVIFNKEIESNSSAKKAK